MTGGGRRGGKPAAPASRGPSPAPPPPPPPARTGSSCRASGRPRESEPEPEREREQEPGRARWAPPAMDHKPLLQERPPAYNLEAGQGDFACGPHGYGAIPAAAPPPPYPYLVTGGPGARGRGAGWGSGRDPGGLAGGAPGSGPRGPGSKLWAEFGGDL